MLNKLKCLGSQYNDMLWIYKLWDIEWIPKCPQSQFPLTRGVWLDASGSSSPLTLHPRLRARPGGWDVDSAGPAPGHVGPQQALPAPDSPESWDAVMTLVSGGSEGQVWCQQHLCGSGVCLTLCLGCVLGDARTQQDGAVSPHVPRKALATCSHRSCRPRVLEMLFWIITAIRVTCPCSQRLLGRQAT